MHKKNKHTDDYDFNQLSLVHTDLESFIFTNANNKKTIDFANPKAVKALNTAFFLNGLSEFGNQQNCLLKQA